MLKSKLNLLSNVGLHSKWVHLVNQFLEINDKIQHALSKNQSETQKENNGR